MLLIFKVAYPQRIVLSPTVSQGVLLLHSLRYGYFLLSDRLAAQIVHARQQG